MVARMLANAGCPLMARLCRYHGLPGALLVRTKSSVQTVRIPADGAQPRNEPRMQVWKSRYAVSAARNPPTRLSFDGSSLKQKTRSHFTDSDPPPIPLTCSQPVRKRKRPAEEEQRPESEEVAVALAAARVKNEWLTEANWALVKEFAEKCIADYFHGLGKEDGRVCAEHAKECAYSVFMIVITYLSNVSVEYDSKTVETLCNVIVHLSVKFWGVYHYDQDSFVKMLKDDFHVCLSKRDVLNMEVEVCNQIGWSVPRPKCDLSWLQVSDSVSVSTNSDATRAS